MAQLNSEVKQQTITSEEPVPISMNTQLSPSMTSNVSANGAGVQMAPGNEGKAENLLKTEPIADAAVISNADSKVVAPADNSNFSAPAPEPNKETGVDANQDPAKNSESMVKTQEQSATSAENATLPSGTNNLPLSNEKSSPPTDEPTIIETIEASLTKASVEVLESAISQAAIATTELLLGNEASDAPNSLPNASAEKAPISTTNEDVPTAKAEPSAIGTSAILSSNDTTAAAVEAPKKEPSVKSEPTGESKEITIQVTATENPKPTTSADESPKVEELSTSSESSKPKIAAERTASAISSEVTLPATNSESAQPITSAVETAAGAPKDGTTLTTSAESTFAEKAPTVTSEEVIVEANNELPKTTASTDEKTTVIVASSEVSSNESQKPEKLADESTAAASIMEPTTTTEDLPVTKEQSDDRHPVSAFEASSKSAGVGKTARRTLLPLRASRRDRKLMDREREARRLEYENKIHEQRMMHVYSIPGPYNRELLFKSYNRSTKRQNFDNLEAFSHREGSRIGKLNDKHQLRLDQIKATPGPYNRELLLEDFDRILSL